MLELLLPLALLSSLSTASIAPKYDTPQPIAKRAMELASAHHADTSHMLQAGGDSLTNGTVIGAVVGGVLGLAAAGLGCAAGGVLSTNPDEDCGAAPVVGALLGAVIGAGVGRGIDAMLEQSPYAAGAKGRRKGLRVRWRF
jgi:hypothetical protein